MTPKPPAGTPAMVALTRAGLPFTVHTYQHDPAVTGYGLEAADALGLAAEVVFKTLLADADGELAVAVVPVSAQLDLKALASALHVKKTAMADPVVAARVTGYVVGGISPIGQKRSLRTVVDVSAAEHPCVYVSGGRRGLDLGLSPQDLLTATGGVLARIRRSS
ncbi:MAG TPA: Cys-tRNA(Pro) deacylase [Marmoricola sp.]|jgi:Cys-tRNA(Pro)/Cys-tRNA(Cys) deacylase|nr:Cys-tRNA(Pro) deacylase [Marmoricola sp.]